MNQTPSQRRDLRRAIPQWREYSRAIHATQAHRAAVDRLIAFQDRRRGASSNAHRDTNWCRDIAPEIVGFLSLFAIGAALLVFCGLIVQAVVA